MKLLNSLFLLYFLSFLAGCATKGIKSNKNTPTIKAMSALSIKEYGTSTPLSNQSPSPKNLSNAQASTIQTTTPTKSNARPINTNINRKAAESFIRIPSVNQEEGVSKTSPIIEKNRQEIKIKVHWTRLIIYYSVATTIIVGVWLVVRKFFCH